MSISRNSKILGLLLSQAEYATKAAELFITIAHNKDYWVKGSQEIKSLEAEADQIIRSVIEEIEAVFILPFDKEDIEELTIHLDDFIDNLEEVSNRLCIYNLPKSTYALQSFSVLLHESSKVLFSSMKEIKDNRLNSPELLQGCDKIREIEHRGDDLHRKVLKEMMSKPEKNVLEVVNWKEIYQILEDTLDICNFLASLFLRLRLKYSG